MVAHLFSENNIKQVKDLLASYNLNYDDEYDSLMGVHDSEGRLIATGARSSYVLKMIAVSKESQSTELYTELITALVSDGFDAGYESFLIFTKPEIYSAFTALNFHLLSITAKVALLEYGKGLKSYLESHKDIVIPGENGAVIMNCNPFTKGHQYLVEQAASMCDTLYVFVVEEDSSSFPFSVRYKLVAEGVKHIKNVQVLPTSYYAVSRGTFPSYFISKDTDVIRHQIETDLYVFSKHIAPYFKIVKRFAGSEPYCGVTNLYNNGMREILPEYGIKFVEIPRMELDDGAVSASKVRKLIINGKMDEAEKFLPVTTSDYIYSDDFKREINTKIMGGRH